MKRKMTLFFSCLLGASLAYGQVEHDHNKCGTDHYYQQQMHADPAVKERAAQFEADYQKHIEENKHRQNKGPEKFIIPTVFHVFHMGGPENISSAQILDQIDSLNRAFNSVKFERVREIFYGVAADCEIEFRLATIDPNGNCTDGIVRVYTLETENATDNIKTISAWPTDRYFNVWVVKDINRATQSLGTVLGYAQFPWFGYAQTDGVVIRHDNVGSIGTGASPSVGVPQWGSTLVHEAGHWLGLYHPFQDSCFGGDQVDDTPPVEGPNFGCNYNVNSCTNELNDLPDMVENYMDYANGSCMGLFTIGQKQRMQTTLKNWRPKLWLPSNLVATGTADPYVYSPSACAPIAYFYTTTQDICVEKTTLFRNNTYNTSTSGLTYQWEFPGGTPSTSNVANPPAIQYNEAGVYDVTLIVSNANGADTFTRQAYVGVQANSARFGAGFTEDFEFPVFPVNDWRITSTSATQFQRVTTGAGSINGEHAIMVLNSAIEAGARHYLESPSVDVSVVDNPVLSFYYASAQRNSSGSISADALAISTSTDCGSTWIQRFFIPSGQMSTIGGTPYVSLNFVPSGESQWRKIDVPLNAIPVDQRNNIRFRFDFRSDGGHNFYLDNINIGFSVGLDQLANDGSFSVYPNPSHGNTNIRINMPDANNARLEVIDMYGRTVKVLHDGAAISGEQEYVYTPESDLSNGMYVVRLTVDGQSFTRKLMLINGQ